MWPSDISDIVSYPTLFLAGAVTGILVPIPEDILLLFGGIEIAQGNLSALPTYLVLVAALLTRDSIVWGIGRWFGGSLLNHRWAVAIIGKSSIEGARALIQTKGTMAVLIGRIFIGFRTPVFLTAGTMGVPFTTFILWDLLGLSLLVPITLTIGYVAGIPILEFATELLATSRNFLLLGFFGMVLIWVWRRFKRHST